MKLNFLLKGAVIFLLPTALAAIAAPNDGSSKIIYQKQMFDKKIVVVARREIPYVPPTETELKSFSPGVTLTKPDHIYLYDFTLREAKQGDKILWSHQVNQFNSMETLYGKFEIYDAVFANGNLIVTWTQAGVVYANIIRPDAQNHYHPLRWQNTRIQVDNATFGPVATGASIEGNLKRGTLAVVLTNVASADVLKKMGGSRSRYSFQVDKWVKAGPVAALQPPGIIPKTEQKH